MINESQPHTCFTFNAMVMSLIIESFTYYQRFICVTGVIHSYEEAGLVCHYFLLKPRRAVYCPEHVLWVGRWFDFVMNFQTCSYSKLGSIGNYSKDMNKGF